MSWDEAEHPRDADGRFTYARLWRVVTGVSQTGAGGAYYGRGRYFSTDEQHARDLLEGYQAYVSEDARLVTGSARVRNPFHVHAVDTGETPPGTIMHRALREAGIAGPTERLTPEQIQARLIAAGYDSVEVHQPGPINHQVGGSQLLVFNHADSQIDDDWATQAADRLAPSSPLQAALRSGIARETENQYQGNSGDTVTRVEFNDGTVGIRKKFNPRADWQRQPVESADAEMLGTAVAQALGVPTPELVRTAPDEILTVYIPSKPSLFAQWKNHTGLVFHTDRGVTPGRAHTSAEFRLAVFDLLTENHDRDNPTNLRLSDDGTQYTIDHEKLFNWEGGDRGPDRPGNMGGPGAYAKMFVQGFENPKWATHPLTPADVAWLRSRLATVRPQFQAAGRMEWWDGMSARLEAIAKKARGTEDLLG